MRAAFTFIALLFTGSLMAQIWEIQSSYKANPVSDLYVSPSENIVIFNGSLNNQSQSFRSLNNGDSWDVMTGPSGAIYSMMYAESHDTLFNLKGTSDGGEMIYSLDNGTTWNSWATASGFMEPWSGGITSFHVFNDNFYISTDDTLIITNSKMSEITYVDPDFTTFLNDQESIKKMVQLGSDLYILGEDFPAIMKSSDEGLTWTNANYGAPFTGYLFDITVDNGKLYAANYDKIFELDPGSNTWTEFICAGLPSWVNKMIVSGDTIITTGRYAPMHMSTDHGASFEEVESFKGYGLAQSQSGLMWNRIVKANNTYIVGHNYGTMKADASDMIFESALNGHYAENTWTTDIVVVNGEIMTTTTNNMRYKYDELNDVWIYLGVNVEHLEGTNETAYKSQLKRYGDTVYSTYPNLIMTTDMGVTWDTLLDGGGPTLTTPYAYMDMDIAGNDIYLGTANDVRVTSDMGATWTVLQLGSASAMCYKDGELFHSDANGDITYSSDNGTTFTNIQGNLSGNVLDIKVAGGTIFAVVNLSAWNSDNEIWHSDNRNGVWVQDLQFVNGTNEGSSFDLLECDDRIIATTRRGMFVTSDLGDTWTNINYNLEPTNAFVNLGIYPREIANDTLYAVGNHSIYKLPFPKTATDVNEKLSSEINLKIFPNPTNGISFLNTTENVLSIEVFNQQGKLVSNELVMNKINIEEQPAGLYIVRITTQYGISVKQLTKY